MPTTVTAPVQKPLDVQLLKDLARKEMPNFTLDPVQPANELAWSTRCNGDVGEGIPGEEDMAAGYRFAKAAKRLGFTAEVEDCDEWVFVTVRG